MPRTRNRLVIIVGLTGVGKTTVTEHAIENVSVPVEYLSYGTLLLETGQREGLVHDRDEITDLDPDEYDALQQHTAERINALVSDNSNDDDTVYIVDTHAVLNTPFGYRPGFSVDDITTIRPDQFAFIRASPAEIADRRATDSSRNRDDIPVDALAEQQDVAMQTVMAFAAMARAPAAFIDNPDGEIDAAVRELEPLLDPQSL